MAGEKLARAGRIFLGLFLSFVVVVVVAVAVVVACPFGSFLAVSFVLLSCYSLSPSPFAKNVFTGLALTPALAAHSKHISLNNSHDIARGIYFILISYSSNLLISTLDSPITTSYRPPWSINSASKLALLSKPLIHSQLTHIPPSSKTIFTRCSVCRF